MEAAGGSCGFLPDGFQYDATASLHWPEEIVANKSAVLFGYDQGRLIWVSNRQQLPNERDQVSSAVLSATKIGVPHSASPAAASRASSSASIIWVHSPDAS